MGWRERNAAIEAAARDYLAKADPRFIAPLGTFELAEKLSVDPGIAPFNLDAGSISKVLARMAPHMGAIARHDGPEIVRYGRTWKRWQWYPQGGTNG